MKNWMLFMLICCKLQAQVPMVITARTDEFAVDADSFAGYDKFGFGYAIKDNVISKFNGGSLIQYKSISLGKVTHVDLQNPLQLMVFYEPFNTIVLLDNQLNEIRRINFSDNTDIPVVAGAVGMSSQNRIWIYNSLTQRIGLWDILSNNYMPLTTPIASNIRNYYSNFNTFHWIDEQGRHMYSDIYGMITDLGLIPEHELVSIADERWVFYSKNGKLFAFDSISKQSLPLKITEKTFKSFYATPQILAIFTASGITNYKITLP